MKCSLFNIDISGIEQDERMYLDHVPMFYGPRSRARDI